MFRQGQNILDILYRPIYQVCNVFCRSITAVVLLRLKMIFGTQDLVQFAHHVDRQAHRARLIHDGPLNALANPPRGIGRKAKSSLGLKLVDGAHQSKIAFFDQIQQGDATVDIVLCNRHDQPQIVLDHGLTSSKFALLGQGREMQFFGSGQQRARANLVQVMLRGIGRQLSGKHFFELFHSFGDHNNLGSTVIAVSNLADLALVNHFQSIIRLQRLHCIVWMGFFIGQLIARTWAHTLTWRQIFRWIDRLALQTDFEVQLHAVCVRIPHLCNFLPLGNQLPFFNQYRLIVRIR